MDFLEARGGVLIIGAGIAGLWTALSLAPRPVTVVTARRLGAGSSSWAQGGLAAAIGPGDTPELHAEDTLAAGCGLCDPEAVRTMTDAGARAVESLSAAGVPFDRTPAGDLELGREAAHGRERIVHVGGDEAGAAIMRVLIDRVRKSEAISILEGHVAERLLTDDQGVAGALTWSRERQRAVAIGAGAVVLATGGLGGLYAVTTNPLSAQGHAIALAGEAGATLRDLEFVQFHPTGLDIGRDPAPLATEAIRGAGAQLVDGEGGRFMPRLHPDAELGPRDVVARGVAQAIAETGRAFLDVRATLGESFARDFPTVAASCRRAGIKPETDLIPVAPAAHYHMGGIRTDIDGASDIDGLFAVGECASTGVHGANRLASNSLLEAIVFGTRIAERLKGSAVAPRDPAAPEDGILPHLPAREGQGLRRLMSGEVGLLRSAASLGEAAAALEAMTPETVGDRLAITAARMVIASALARQESRGAHHRIDYPAAEDRPRHTLVRAQGGTIQIHWEDAPA